MRKRSAGRELVYEKTTSRPHPLSPHIVFRSHIHLALMPRAKVAPENRRRIQRACEACRTSKRRCDGAQPCRVCVRRGQLTTCVYAPQDARQPLPQHTARYALPLSAPAPSAPIHSSTAIGQTFAGQINQCAEQKSPSEVYVGNVSGLSFLNYLKHALRHHLGPSQFTTEPASEWMLETFDVDTKAAPVQSDPAVKSELAECYFIAVSCARFQMYSRY
nr:oleate activated transcription factor 3 [Quercus suber]